MRTGTRVLISLTLLCATSQAAVPPFMNYQGVLLTTSGIPVADGPHAVTFGIFNSQSGGSPLWSESQTVVTSAGLLSTVLGTVNPIPDTAMMDSASYLEITVESDPPMSPRTRLVSAGFSMLAGAVDGEGPLHLETVDEASGDIASVTVSAKEGATKGKNIRKNITVLAAAGDNGAEDEVLNLADGYARNIHFEVGGDTLDVLEAVNLPSATKSAVAIPALMKNARKAKFAESASTRETLDTDSGYVHSVILQNSNGHAEVVNSVAAPSLAAIAIPNLLEARKSSNESDTVETREIVDADSGYSHTAHQTGPTGFGSVVQTGLSQTREHVLLARQVGVPGGGTAEHSMELQTSDTGAESSLRYATSDNDSSTIETHVNDIEQSFEMATLTGATKWKNIVLKRGLTSTEMTLSHVSAGATGVIYATASAASGARLGINTLTPSLEFQLVGSGCYTGTFGVCSDRRYKKDIHTLRDPLKTVGALRGVRFEWRQDEFPNQGFAEGEQVGLIAQEVEGVVPSVVTTDASGYKSVDYARLVPILIEAMKEQQQEIETLKKRLDQAIP